MIQTEDLYNNPEATVIELCKHLNISFIPQSLTWNTLDANDDIYTNWDESKQRSLITHWHGDALSSTGFSKPHQYEVNGEGNPTFSEVPELHKNVCRVTYKVNKVYYDMLLHDYKALTQVD